MLRNRLADIMQKRELSRSELARQAGVAVWTVRRLANNPENWPRREAGTKICRALGLKWSDIFYEAEL